MPDEVISFFDCAAALRKERSVTVSSDDRADQPNGVYSIAGYTYFARAARTFTCWITVTAERFCRAVVRIFRARFRNIVRNTGVRILPQRAILRI